ncbi:Spx/MgsR family RNA polymerase-binding regulatory protein [Helicobacter cinaedi]|uniref:ArsC family arsenate reductase n=1 Tax=Helicobacter cinaedi CCUG 18818 = ATCC BAA-847 TaxID=537971 RepID=A0AAI8MMA2_9HELI|nr:arsenate reductase family protein [Helicobacter cinaedi]EFR46756.1 transcriptional regulator, Spx/MgsR family [Helicobacter cinaedi CCUG 18818 = ATCC BAA-847]QOQ91712.1 Spx/MgsR family RNA polymerase-binding regulatory protein [Helicobacter cinaedi]BAM32213.1 putative ArsC family arsenate reductase [Helicobacter cinaedi CCUG 18818 = ATCC BAA-847]
MTIILYGIKTCGSVKKAITLLDKHSIPFHFIDLKTTTPSQKQLKSWIESKGIKVVLNSKGTTYKNLKKEGKITESILDSHIQEQIDILFATPMLLKRPIITSDKRLIIGYNESEILELIHAFQQRAL